MMKSQQIDRWLMVLLAVVLLSGRVDAQQTPPTEKKDAEKKDTEKKDVEKKDVEKKDVEKKDVEKKDVEKKDAEKKDAPRFTDERREERKGDPNRRAGGDDPRPDGRPEAGRRPRGGEFLPPDGRRPDPFGPDGAPDGRNPPPGRGPDGQPFPYGRPPMRDGFGPPMMNRGGPLDPTRLEEMQKNDPEMYALESADQDLDRQAQELSQQLRRASGTQRDEVKKKLQTVVLEHFNARQARRELQLKRLESELTRMRESMKKREEMRDEIVSRRVAELAGEQNDLDF